MIEYKQCNSIKEREELLRKVLVEDIKNVSYGAFFVAMSHFVERIIEKGFCEAPASTKYHGAYEGGLFDHSLYVTAALSELTEKLGLKWEREVSPIIVGMLHDLCKIDNYKFSEKSFFGAVPAPIEYNQTLVKGHSYKSVIYIQNFGLRLTEEEMICILYHMGAYETENWKEFDAAIKKYPNVLYTHMADMIASKIGGI